MSGQVSAYEGLGLSPRTRRTVSSLAVAFALVAGVLGLAPSARADTPVTVTGRLTTAEGAAAPGVAVTADFSGSTTTTTLTGSDGRYTLRVPAYNSFRLCSGAEYAPTGQQGDTRYVSGCSNSYYYSGQPGGTITIDRQVTLGGILTGHVSATGGRALAGVRVSAISRARGGNRAADTAVTDSNGVYSMTLAPATYHVRFQAQGYATVWDENAHSNADADDDPVGRGDTVTVDATLAPESGLFGHVDGSISSTRGAVSVYDATTHQLVRRFNLGADRSFAATGLATGSYKVAFNRLSGYSYGAAQFYDLVPEGQGFGSAGTINYTAGQSVFGIDGSIDEGGVISGHLIGADGGRSLRDCTVQAYTRNGSLVTRTGQSGSAGRFFVRGLSTGNYFVRVLAPKRGRDRSQCDGARMYVGPANALTADPTKANHVHVVQGDSTDLGDLSYQRGGTVEGHVMLPTGDNQENDRAVVVRGAGDKVVGLARVRNDGTYTVRGLITGTYRVTFARVSGPALAQATYFNAIPESGTAPHGNVSVTTGQATSGIDATLALGGTLTGRIRDAAGQNLSGCYVQAYTADGARVTRAAYTSSDGAFSIGGLTTGDYLFRVIGQRSRRSACYGATQYFTGSAALGNASSGATPVHVTAGQSRTVLGLPLVFTTPDGATLGGHVTFPNTSDRRSRGSERYVVLRNLTTHTALRTAVDRNGEWLLHSMAPGTYRVAFNRLSGFASAAAQFYTGKDESVGGGGATLLTVSNTTVKTDIDAALKTGGQLSGTLVDQSGRALRCTVQAFTGDGHYVTRSTTTGSNGSFAIRGLTTGKYKLRVVPSYGCATMQYLQGTSGSLSPMHTTYTVNATQGATASVGKLTYGGQIIGLPPVANRVPPSVTGTPQVGSTLTAAEGTWKPGTVHYDYQWFAGTTAISGATGRTFVPTSAQVGQPLAVRVTASRDGYTPTGRTSAKTAAVAPAPSGPVVTPPTNPTPTNPTNPTTPTAPSGPKALTLSDKPSVDGKAVVGGKLKADAGATSPSASSVHYQWLLNGKAIKGATKSSLKLSKAEQGKKISVQVTYSTPGYADLVATSGSDKVKPKPAKGKPRKK